MHGLVIRSTGSFYTVLADSGELLTCRLRGNLRLRGIRSTNPVVVGDHVEVSSDGQCLITDICERRNYIIRRAPNLSKESHILAANIDQALLLVTLSHPETSTTFIDRFLASAEAYSVPVTLLFNKTDLCGPDLQPALSDLVSLYTGIGYPCLRLSASQGTGLPLLQPLLAGKISLLAGHSGVGKTTLLNALILDLNLRTAALSASHDTGMHTTTCSEMYPIAAAQGGGYLIDTPGIKGFGTFDMERHEVAHYFRELFALTAQCRFGASCTHTCEPGCAVLQALAEHRIAQSRYVSYLSMLDDKDEDRYRPAF
jgi:ribosome biogenesis GTPase / thiamine phosphate phosphatase